MCEAAALLRAQPLLNPPKAQVGHEGQCRSRNCTSENKLIAYHCQPTKDEFSEATCSNGGGNSCEANREHGGYAHARNDHPQSQREFDLKSELAICHTHCAGSFDGR